MTFLSDPRRRQVLMPIIIALSVSVGLFFGSKIANPSIRTAGNRGDSDLDYIFQALDKRYYDSVDIDQLREEGINKMLHTLDPFSTYIPEKLTEAVNAPLEGEFEGIGVSFFILNDTVLVEEVIAGGPSEAVGLHAGDRIVSVDGKNIAGVKIESDSVVRKLKGKGGTKVKVGIVRNNQPVRYFTITRGTIPIVSVDVNYMLDATTGYVKVNKFSQKTPEEFFAALSNLSKSGAKKIVLDLRGNGGGFLNAAIDMAQQFLGKDELVTFTKGLHEPKSEYRTQQTGMFKNMDLVVLIDEGSASASEIVSGAMQDLDRATIIGRRSFGKGLVQDQLQLPSGAALRITIARYYTPSGRCIQKPFDNQSDFEMELANRYTDGEVFGKKGAPKGKAFKTKNGRTVYDGGGITPDIIVPLDTTSYTKLWNDLFDNGILIDFSYKLAENRDLLKAKYTTEAAFIANYSFSDAELAELKQMAIAKGVKWNDAQYAISKRKLENYLKAQLGKHLFGQATYYKIINAEDAVVRKALSVKK